KLRNGAAPFISKEELEKIHKEATEKGHAIYGDIPFEVVVIYDPLEHTYQGYYQTKREYKTSQEFSS
ncbi:hypothetical protein HYT57_01215, partial [Candidatus Woesearchaeota archaeon]|nr:hypothetical protein [Candidatus Woesearchaeota archaeon]